MEHAKQYQPGKDISLDAALRVLQMRGFARRLTDQEWIDSCKLFKFTSFGFDVFTEIAKKTPGYNAQGMLKKWNSVALNGGKPPTVGGIVKAARSADKELFQTLKKTLATGENNDSLPERKADKIAWLLRNYKIEYNELRDAVYVNGEMLSDNIFASIHFDLMNHGVNSKQAIETVLLTLAQINTYHPIKQYFQKVKQNYDGSNQIDLVSGHFYDEHGLFPLYFRKWMLGAVAKVMESFQNPMFVLMGAQEAGKGFFADWLCPNKELFISSPILPDNKDHMLRACDRFIWEVVELGSTTRRADIEALKAFITQGIFTVRRPYGRFDVDKVTTASFLGTINDDGGGFLNDVSGNRRYRPLTLKNIDWDYAKEAKTDLLWGQAVTLYESGESLWLSKEEKFQLNTEILPKYRRVNLLEELISENYEPSQYIMSSHDILTNLYENGFKGRNSTADAMQLSSVMKSLGYEKISNGKKRGYLCQIIGDETPELF